MLKLRCFVVSVVIVLAFATAVHFSYWRGYRVGFDASHPKPWTLVSKNKRSDGTFSGNSYTWFNLNDPDEVANLRKEEARLKAAGTDFYLHEGRAETSIFLKPDPSHADSQR